MHLIVAFAAPLSEGARAVLPTLATPALERLLARWTEVGRDAGDDDMLSPPHERALAAALGLVGADGALPWAARQAALDGVDVGDHAWGLLTPVHWRVAGDGVHLADPAALALSAADSHALWDAVRPLFEGAGYLTAWGGALRWYVAHDSLQGLETTSLDRVVGRNIDPWLPRQAAAKPLRRLQNEAQMLLHAHPLNEAREAAGALAVNSFWLSGCGRSQAAQDSGVTLDDSLRSAAMQGDWAAWRAAWQALDERAIATLMAAAARGEAVRLTLCGERSAAELAPRAQSAWRRLIDALSPSRPRSRQWLESL
jgi:hypothetical protein